MDGFDRNIIDPIKQAPVSDKKHLTKLKTESGISSHLKIPFNSRGQQHFKIILIMKTEQSQMTDGQKKLITCGFFGPRYGATVAPPVGGRSATIAMIFV